MAFRPLHDRVLVEPLEAAEKTAGGIIIPDTAQEKPMEGRVIAVGSGYRLDDGATEKLSVKAGDRVLYSKFGGTDVRIDGKDRLILKETDILAVIEESRSSKRKAA